MHSLSLPDLALQAGLSPRECEAFFLQADGCTEEEIAHRMGVSVSCVRSHLCRVGQRIRLEQGRVEEKERVREAVEIVRRRVEGRQTRAVGFIG